VQWGDGEALCLALLPGELVARDEVQCDIYCRHQLAAEFSLHPKIAHLDVVVLVEPGEWIFFAIGIRRAPGRHESTARDILHATKICSRSPAAPSQFRPAEAEVIAAAPATTACGKSRSDIPQRDPTDRT
jgi:hypothetical protein